MSYQNTTTTTTLTRKVKDKVININIEKVEEAEGIGLSQLWSAKDYDQIVEIMAKIREDGKTELVKYMVNDAVDIYYGKVPSSTVITPKPKMVSIDHNVVTHPGIALTNKNITGQDMTRFLYIMSGEGNTEAPTIHSSGIEDENARISILDTGFFFANGTALFQGCVFPTTIPDAVVKTFGSATHADPGANGYTVFWVNRLMDPSKFVYHFQNKTIYSHMHVIDRRSRLSE